MIGTTLRTKADWDPNIFPQLATQEGWVLLGTFTGAVPNGVTRFATGCLLTSDDDGKVYKNVGDEIVSNFVELTGGGGGGNFVFNEEPFGVIDSVNTVFTLAFVPSPGNSLQLFLNGAFQTNTGIDYTLVGNTITFVNPPLTGGILRAFYLFV